MMFVADLELCKTLYELSGWVPEDKYWLNGRQYGVDDKLLDSLMGITKAGKKVTYPAYDAGFLLQKLPGYVSVERFVDHWKAIDYEHKVNAHADTPENALAQLCIELFNQGILQKGE